MLLAAILDRRKSVKTKAGVEGTCNRFCLFIIGFGKCSYWGKDWWVGCSRSAGRYWEWG